MSGFLRDAEHWLLRFSPTEWIRRAMTELRRAEEAYARRDGRGGLAGCRRAAGMALNAALIVEPDPSWGRTYVEHLAALGRDDDVPDEVRKACEVLLSETPPGGPVVTLRSRAHDDRILEAAKDVLAHAYAVAVRHGALTSLADGDDEGGNLPS